MRPAAEDLSQPPNEPAITVDEVAQRYWARAHRFAAMVTRNDQDSADLAQEALIQVIRRFHRFDASRGSLDAWLWRIVVNVARDAGRASVRRAVLWERLKGYRSTDPVDSPETIALRELSDRELLQAVRSLKLRPRTLIALRFGAQLSYAEIAAQLGITEAAALMATRRALQILRTDLEVNR
jgi:RNA polymerase sigma-70 factor (ECF subfamily)